MTSSPLPPARSADSGATAVRAFQEMLERTRVSVETSLTALFETKLTEASAHGPDVRALVEATRSLTLRGGKRLRAAMAIAGAHAAAGNDFPMDQVRRLGVALELLQTFFLVHDDWMDNDDLRRGGPTVHVMLAAQLGSKQLGASSAILAGDFAATLAHEVIAGAPSHVALLFARIQQDAIYGQQLDLLARTEDIERVHTLKTGSYTVEGPVALGAERAGASAACRAAIHAYAAPLGVAFQLRDDILGTFGSPEETGKPAGNDLRAGKRTALIAEAETRLSATERARLASVLGHADSSDDAIAEIRAILTSSGSLAAVETRITGLLASALAVLDSPALHPAGAELLAGAAVALTARRS
jgi:geranylgeranyl diphosphate synthase, type I